MNQSSGTPSDEIQTLQLACDRLRQQAHFQAAFLGTASHELRAPINQIISLHQLILEDLCESPAEEREFIAQANQAITTVLKNLDTLINLSKLDIGALKPQLELVSLASILATVEQFTAMKCINRHCRLTLAHIEPSLLVQTDPRWFQQMGILLIEAALAAGSQQITIYLDTAATDTVTLYLDCDSALAPWQTPLPAVTLPTVTEQGDLSPAFSYQMAARMAPYLDSVLTLERKEDKPLTQVALTLRKKGISLS